MIQKAAHEAIREGVELRGLQGMDHVVLNAVTQGGIRSFLNHVHRDDYASTAKVSQGLLDDLGEFKLVFADDFRMSELTYTAKDNTLIWPRTNLERTQAVYSPNEVKIALPDGGVATLWTVFLPARVNEGDIQYAVVSCARKSSAHVERFLTLINHLVTEVHAKAKYIDVFGGADIRIRGEHCWEDLVLTQDVVQSVKDDLEFWIASEGHYRSRHIPYRRGYLFEGPPGNGKTAVARTILSVYDFAAYSFNFSNRDLNDASLQEAFNSAAGSAPSVFLLEDIDRIFEEHMSYSMVTKEGLFNCLDGVATHAGLVVIATANHPEVLDAALRHRPGRFDVPVRFDNPEQEQRERFLQRLLGGSDEHEVDGDTLMSVAHGCKGMSMAFIKLVYETAAVKSFKERGTITITAEDLTAGLSRSKGYYDQMEVAEERSAGFKSNKDKKGCPTLRPRGPSSKDTMDSGFDRSSVSPTRIGGGTKIG